MFTPSGCKDSNLLVCDKDSIPFRLKGLTHVIIKIFYNLLWSLIQKKYGWF